MNKVNLIAIVLINIVLCTVSCSKNEQDKETVYTVSFDADGGSPAPANQTIKAGDKAVAPATNPGKANHDFLFWSLKDATTAYDFNTPVTGNITLYAKWTTAAGIYSAGYYVNANNVNVACYWKNTVRHDLTDGTSGAQAHDITVVGDIVYTAGYYRNGTTMVACYWINEQKYDLSTAPDYGEAMAIRVYNGKVYTAGYCNTSNNNKNACYWVNQERHDIYTVNTSYQGRNNVARDITVLDNVVYTCGTYHNGTNTIACFWAGSNKYNLQGSGYNSYAYSMYYNSSKFYIAGSNTDGTPCYFTAELNGNNSRTNLNSNQTGGYAYAKDICVSNNVTYTVGYRGSTSSIYNALFWKNNDVREIIGSDYNAATAKDYTAESIYLSNDVLYIAGNNHNSAACYWKRNINSTSFLETILYENGKANAIFVK
jgi:hypothetical protein